MATFEAKKINAQEINNGNKYENGDIVDANAINAPIETALYVKKLVENQPTVSEQMGARPSVSIVDENGEPRFHFSSIKGESAYEIAVKNGFVGSEADWANLATGNHNEVKSIAKSARLTSEINRKKIISLEQEVYGDAYYVDDGDEYQKFVPIGAASYAEVTSLGGYSQKTESNNLAQWVYGTIEDEGITCVFDENCLTITGVTTKEKHEINVLCGIMSQPCGFVFPSIGSGMISGFPKQSNAVGYDGYYPPAYFAVDTGALKSFIDSGDGVQWSTGNIIGAEVVINQGIGKTINIKFKLMINEGTVALPFEDQASLKPNPIKAVVGKTLINVPQSVLNLDGFGHGVQDCFNYIEWRPEDGIKAYHRVCAIRNSPLHINALAQNGVWGLYPLEQEEVIDISDILPNDNIVMVESGGFVTFENDALSAVPSTITYLMREEQ